MVRLHKGSLGGVVGVALWGPFLRGQRLICGRFVCGLVFTLTSLLLTLKDSRRR